MTISRHGGAGQAVHSMMVLHARLRCFRDEGAPQTMELVMAPAFLKDTTTRTLQNALVTRLPISLPRLQKMAQTVAIQLVSDSAAACVKVGKIFRSQSQCCFEQQSNLSGCVATHSLCLMHATHSSVSAALKLLSLHAPIFCGSVLMRQGKTFDNVRKMVKERVSKNLSLTYKWDPSFKVAEAYLRRVLELAEFDHELMRAGEDGVASGARCRRTQAQGTLAKLVSASTFVDDRVSQLRHYCPLGCCGTKDEAISKVTDAILDVILPAPPKIPALNRWTLLYGPMAFWLFAMIFAVPADVMQTLAKKDMEASLEGLADIDAAGPGDDDTYRIKKRMRCTRFVNFLSADATQLAMQTAVTCLSILMPLSAFLFQEAKFSNADEQGMLAFCIPSRSPAVTTVGLFMALLQQPDSDFWFPVAGITGWTRRKFEYVVTVSLLLAGQVFMRHILPMRMWPWLSVAQLFQSIAHALIRCSTYVAHRALIVHGT